ncbi:DoxX family protein [Nocardioides marmoriginsengisoli]|uniref:DoxX family protein n=1 Tax=Nocardioides marmoriginsengisoli TaxID=661483 RepID=A0A3N0CLM7_9ACTN|nr:DoxX family protein [Nocardioides marmoriginsengisoli]RNL64375.1 DoxX family protein [Nocardioides marmoriginsengisoli]
MNVAVWIVSGLLAAAYLMAGLTKSTQPIASMREKMGWVDDFSVGTVRFIGVAELLGALGLILPKLTDVVDDRAGVEGTLTGLAATGLVAVQVLAMPVHLKRGETSALPINLVLGLLAAFVAAARFGWL